MALGVGAGVWWTWRQPQAAVLSPPRPSGETVRATPRVVLPTARPQPGPRGGALRGASPAVVRSEPTPAARVALIFDDAGATLQQVEPILALGRPVTLAVLPGLAASAAVARRAQAAGLEVLLHLPLESEEDRRLGPGGVTTAMSDEEIAAVVRAGLAEVPGAVGINGHMGSRATADLRVMTAVLGVVREQGLFFVDSRTTPRTVAMQVARALGVPAVERTVFLDNEDEPAYITGQVRRLLEAARTRGWAIGIGHAQRGTAEVLRQLLPEFDRAGVVLVPVSDLLNTR
ncbi:MAG: divergent polysaccharide deacetylase family protein [Armatimonadota bacterium]|nr:divergent polysaccharide deacetylase family protein [Armatimonadota bacterium]MDR7427186.1 divergent polysaccharide deacetylase family protein [Armatimonadota bacterium]MDR7464994.1 divergent polysaccharide deacetylase family protein [Armatimonadota bacterium]MDR7473531.1 divergent polysaccharide deacetylase family protein [Armatimonadota bacterium]MDR7539990.1 divergent polysaccharide deacetylase family protein [Armatimonadota bacterium]